MQPEPKPEPEPEPVAATSEQRSEGDAENLAALLLGTDDGPAEPLSPSDIPEGTTVFDVPAVGGQKQDPKQPAAPPPSTRDAADAILKKYMRRPRN